MKVPFWLFLTLPSSAVLQKKLECFVLWLSVPNGTSNFVYPKMILHNRSHVNKVKLSPKLLYHEPTSDTKTIGSEDHGPSNIGIMDLFRNPFVRKVTLIMFFNWIVVTLGK